MDDLLSGSDTSNNAIFICKDIAHVLSTRGFHLRKWNSNSTEFLTQFLEHSSHDTRVEFSKDSNESSKVLGLFWNSSNDTFGFQPLLELTPPLTKSRILSESSKIFDSLGLLSPCTVFMKIFYQKIWLTKTDWDSPISQKLTDDWLKFQKAFNEINYLTVPRLFPNFVGARRQLDEIRKLWLSLPTNEAISYYLSKSSIDWHFIPPSSLHFGGDVLLSVPEELPSTSNHRDRWELLQNIKRGFWKKWSSDYISSLQPRKKWRDAQPNLKEEDIVLIKEEGPPGTCPMA
ncbi:uncharacterized protein TNCV_4369741 [Trichonephila clavipes]|nr:uncharacterized protein TNCV_4369741 [Trichonephila clavipes]